MTPITAGPRPVLHRRGSIVGGLLAIATIAAAMVAVAPALRAPANVAKLTVDNPTVYQLNVEVTDAPGNAWLDLGAVTREGSKTLEEIADQGERWMFRFSYGGVDAGELVVARSELAAAGWSITIPVEAGERLRAAGLHPSVS